MFNWLRMTASAAPTFWMPSQISTVSENVDSLFYFIYYLCIFFFIAIIAAMIYFVVKFRKVSESQASVDLKGNQALEIFWSLVPGILLLVIFAWGFRDWLNIIIPPSNTLDIRVTGQKWSWSYNYPKDGVETNELVVPAGRAVKLTMSSRDVIHSFYIPDFRIKRDVLPNRYTVVWFQTTQPGEAYVTCTQYCGTNHSKMMSKVRIVSEEDYKKWLETAASAGNGMSAADFGKQLFEQKGCNACHAIDESVKIGPGFGHKYGKQEQMEDGTAATVDDNYIRECVNNASKRIKGFQPVMPPFKGQLSDKQLDALVEYIKSLR